MTYKKKYDERTEGMGGRVYKNEKDESQSGGLGREVVTRIGSTTTALRRYQGKLSRD